MKPELTSYLNDLQNVLLPWQNVYRQEVLDTYPRHGQSFPSDWIDWARRLSDEELFLWEAKRIIPLGPPPELLTFFDNIGELTARPTPMPVLENQLDSYAFLNVKEKKRHELERLLPYLAQWIEQERIEQVIDVGSGIGPLSQCLSRYHHTPVLCLDQDEQLLAKGELRNQRRGAATGPVYVRFEGKKNYPALAKISKHLHPGRKLCMGLHTCGDLALVQLQLALEMKAQTVVHFGCCYHKLTPTFALSTQAMGAPMDLNIYALTLAAKSYQRFDREDFQFKLRVKNYRYMFHLFLYHELGLRHFPALGPSAYKLYQQDFSTYAQEQLRRLRLPDQRPTSLDDFYSNSTFQQLTRELILTGILRGELGRLLELWLLSDRALFLQEWGYEVSLRQFFARERSPRNIGIYAHLR